MPIYEVTPSSLIPLVKVTFGAVNLKEKDDLQRLIRDQIDVISPHLLVIAEEYGSWEDSYRRIDLLCVDTQADLVVVELKRTEDGGHMELQALRYAAMVSAMTFKQAVSTYSLHLQESEEVAETKLLGFLGWNEPQEDRFAQDVRIILVSADFSKEMTTTVMWLNQRNLDIRCIRLRPYTFENNVLIDVQQIIPLQEASDYQIKIKEKKQKEQESIKSSYTKFNVQLGGEKLENLPKGRSMLEIVKYLCKIGESTEAIKTIINKSNAWKGIPGKLNLTEFLEEAGHDPKFDPARWFLKPDDLIYQHETTYAFTNQWGTDTESLINKLLDQFPDAGIKYEKILSE